MLKQLSRALFGGQGGTPLRGRWMMASMEICGMVCHRNP